MKIGTLVKINDISEADEKFKTLNELGFTACQLIYKPLVYKKEDALIIKAASEKYKIDISAQFCGFYDNETIWDIYYGYQTAGINVDAYRQSRMEYLKKAFEFASNLGITDVVIHAGYVPNNPFAPEYSLMVTSVHILADYLKKMNMNLLLETGQEAPITLLRLIEDVPEDNVYINFDPANILMYGYGNPLDALEVFGKYVRNMHGKDGKLPTNPKKLGEETVVGNGMVDFEKVFKKLNDLGYDRYVIIEREIVGNQQIKDIIYAKEYFEKLLSNI